MKDSEVEYKKGMKEILEERERKGKERRGGIIFLIITRDDGKEY